MPKITSQGSLAQRRQLETPSNIPRKTKEIDPHQEQDRSQWRPSRLPETAKINKSAALTNYHLSRTNDLDGLSFKTEQTVIKIPGRGNTVVKMFLYSEREVEMRAWEKYGGPKKFERMLDDKEAKFYRKNGGVQSRTFLRPRDYPSKISFGPRVCGNKDNLDPETSTPGLIATKDMLAGRGQQWMWDAINKVISEDMEVRYGDSDYNSGRSKSSHGKERESLVDYALKTLDKYPPRPSGTLAPIESHSFHALITTLARAHAPTYVQGQDDPEVIEIHTDGFTGEESVYWTEKYNEEVYTCLIKIIQDHGLDGCMRARWLVYDQYVRCNMGGLTYSDEHRGPGLIWNDSARFWIDGTTKYPGSHKSEVFQEYQSELQKIGALKS
ncbi:hypothetical protein HYPSUDRAFT_37160 [Hypholoma sublateritium FD-334 SS-4]|uniref:Uncharacterized protein n=1 Tax=Hypholoma sublateritium (strain FD-334 SS-4) TaxID=945553 RepID=A0A0D2P4B6_HYPSF|nr:hypothetical protein HYPSUDRAFT_37160 [Hypholoma sublateritium FD-334 SS-4]